MVQNVTMRRILIFVILCYVAKIDCTIPSDVILAAMNQLLISNPIIIDRSLNTKQRIKVFKSLSNHGHKVSFKLDDYYNHQCYIVFSDILHFNWRIQTNAPSMVISNIQNETELLKLNLSIDNEVYFLDAISWKMFETYTINKIQVTRYLGQFKTHANNVSDYIDFDRSKTYKSSMEERRGNFQGIHLKGMTDYEAPAIDFPEDLDSVTKFFPNNDTYEMSYDIISGIYIELLYSIEKSLNFSTKLYKRKDGRWGTPKILHNGTVVIEGMVKSLYEGSVDIIWTSLYMTLARAKYIGKQQKKFHIERIKVLKEYSRNVASYMFHFSDDTDFVSLSKVSINCSLVFERKYSLNIS